MEITTFSDPPSVVISPAIRRTFPVGALTNERLRFALDVELKEYTSVCNHCAVGCNLTLGTRAAPGAAALGNLCV